MIKKSIKILSFLAVLFGLSTSYAAPPEVLRLVANEWEPYTGEQVLNKGLASEIVTTAFRRAGYDVELQIVPWSRALKGVQIGVYHGIVGAWYSEERTATMLYSDPYLTNDLVLFKKKEADISFNSLEDLEGLTVGVIRDYAYGEEFDQSKKLTRKQGIDLRTNIIRLHKGIVDLFPEDRFVMKHIINQNYPEYAEAFSYLDKPLSQRTLHTTISRKTEGYQQLIDDFNREFKLMKEEGLLELLIKKHKLSF